MSIFKAYDIRGIFGKELTADTSRAIGSAFGGLLGGAAARGRVAIGRDDRASSPACRKAFIEGLTGAGCDCLDIGLVSTPALYFATGRYGCAGGAMITASHNPPEYNGFKLCREEAIPVSYETGIDEIEKAVIKGDIPFAEKRGDVETKDITGDYIEHVRGFAEGIKSLSIVIDASNGVGAVFTPAVFEELPATLEKLYFNIDGTFPNHEPNPLKAENLRDLQAKVREIGADVGFMFDGDADRCAFVDETGEIVPCDLVTALFAKDIIRRTGPAPVVYDLRSSRIVSEEIEALGGTPVMERVGHSFIKATMREHDAVLGGELSGHYYFKNNYYADSGIIACVTMLSVLSRAKKPFSELIEPLKRYYQTGEVNFEVEDKAAAVERLKAAFADGRIIELDGVSVYYDDWWFNVRLSNTEPLLRLNLEADTPELRESAKSRVVEVIKRAT